LSLDAARKSVRATDDALSGGGLSLDPLPASQAGGFRATCALTGYNLTFQAWEGFDYVEAIMHLAFTGDHGSVRSAQLLKYRNAESAPKRIAVARRERRIVERGQDHDRGIQAGQIEQPKLFPARQRQRETKRRNQCVGFPDAQPWQVVNSTLTHVRAEAKALFKQSNPGWNRQWEAKGLCLTCEDTLAESSQQGWYDHLTQ
jgi:hypothetical protein